MCASSGMISQDEELTAILHSHQNTVDSYLAGVVSSSVASASSSLEAAYSDPLQLPYSSDCSMLGPGGSSRAYSDQVGGKPLMPLQTLNLPNQDQGGPQVAPCSPMLPKNGALRPGVWGPTSSNGLQKDWISGRSGMMEMDCRNLPTDYSSALLDQVPAPIADPYRVPGGLARYHSAPSALLQSLADFQQEVSRPMNQLDSSLSSFFTDADLPPLSQSNDASLEQMETEHSSNSVFDKFSMMNTRKFDNRLGKPGAHYDQLGSVNGPTKPHMMQSVFKPSMDVLHENVSGNTQMNTQLNAQINSQLNSQVPSSSQMPSSIGMSSTMGLLGQQDNTHAGQQMGLGNLAQSIGNDFPGNFTGSSGTLAGLTSTRITHKGNNNNSLLRQSSSPAGLLAQLSIDVQTMAAKSEKQSLSSPLAHSPAESLSGGTSEENAGTGPGTPGMMSRLDVGAWEDAQSFLNSWDNTNFAARKRFRDMEIDPLGDSFMPDPLRSSQDHNPAPLTRHMSLPVQKSKNSPLTDDILQSVPCRIRAKRGCATHPRSIAERVRRTRISERMRKLQELVPNMDKQQTNTADMLDEAVEYVKQLQRQVQELTESKCKGNCREHKDNNPLS